MEQTPRPRKRKAPTSVTPDVEADVDGALIAENLQEKRTCTKTKKNYESNVKQAVQWFKKHHRRCLTANEKSLTVPIKRGPLMEFFGYLSRDAHKRQSLNGPEELTADMHEPLSPHTLQGYRSAIVDLYTQKNMTLEPEVNLLLHNTLEGYEKLCRQLRLKALMKIREGKSAITISGYQMIAEKFMKTKVDKNNVVGQRKVASGWSATLFSWAFFVLMWNLMSRSDSVDGLMLQHLKWQEDSLIIEEHGHKGDQTGADSYGKHIYANPFEPSICPILSLAGGSHHPTLDNNCLLEQTAKDDFQIC